MCSARAYDVLRYAHAQALVNCAGVDMSLNRGCSSDRGVSLRSHKMHLATCSMRIVSQCQCALCKPRFPVEVSSHPPSIVWPNFQVIAVAAHLELGHTYHSHNHLQPAAWFRRHGGRAEVSKDLRIQSQVAFCIDTSTGSSLEDCEAG